MSKQLNNALCCVQFIHPGREHRPDVDRFKAWNDGYHKRKFMVCQGRYLRGSKELDTELVFWGEWEPQSEVVCQINQPLPHVPRYIYRPFYTVPHSYKGLQNTDPFVFDKFLYGNCQQNKNTGPTQLRYLERGSVILFGSFVAGAFVLDTVFVVRYWIDHASHNYKSVLDGRVPHGFKEVTLNPLYLSGRSKKGCSSHESSYRLYIGATHDNPWEGMYSFFPCLPFEEGRRGFARPIIRDSEDSHFITNNLPRGYRLNPQVDLTQTHSLWQSVVDQVLKQSLHLGVYAQMPEYRSSKR